ncbi:collagen alpha-2(VI) chain-like [Salvelinus namaycush]|uniref:Collagen alpha-2(VI) chain-like n=1 Tax=Salvelinus namaycush TaxID=8040 RepID=A0A8U0PYF2_SALNM|nr:collagen alpha-2(VI) chain-like [Salvelinus namaycush]
MAGVLKAFLLLWVLQVSAQDPEYDHLLVRPRNINDEKDDCSVNVYFTIDTSESVALREFPWGSLVEELKVFLQMFVERLQTTTLRAKRVQWAYGGLHFSDHVEVFSQVVTDAAVFLGRAQAIRYIGRGTFIDCALRNMTEQVRLTARGKPRLQYAVVLTDGHITGSPCGGVSQAAEAAKAAGIKVFVVATNEETMESELKQIVSSPVELYRKDYMAFPASNRQAAVNRITDTMIKEAEFECQAPMCIQTEGAAGPKGYKGMKGAKGTGGAIGDPGQPGPPGDLGIEGPIGLHGQKGKTGTIGAPGCKGDAGMSGEAGPAGDFGIKGDAGKVLLGRVAGLDHRVMVETVEIRVKLDLVEVLATLGHQVSQGAVVYQVRVERQDFRALRGMQGTLAPEETLEQQELRMLMNILNFQECEIMGFVRETCGCCDCEKVCPPLDLVFVIDSSESIGKTNFSLAKNFVISVANRLGKMAKNISDVSGFRLGVVQYSHQGAVQAIRMDDRGITSATSFNTKVKAMEWIAGGTWTPSALKYTYDHLIVPGRRGRTKVVAIVITDGRYDPKDLDNLGALCNGVDVYAIAIGDMFDSGAERQNMERIACNMGDRVKTLSVYAELTAEEFLEEIEQILCPEPEMICPDLKCASDLSLAPLIQRPVDILFFIDGSERTGGRNFISILRFIERLSQSIPLSKEVSSGARFAVLQFGGEQDPEVLLDFSNNHRKISSLVSNAVYRDSSSTLGSAILYATENLVSNPGGRFRGVRPDAELAFVFITDGVTSDKNFAEGIGAMRRANAVGVAITVGSDIDRERLLQLTLRDKALIFNLKSFNDLALPGVVKHMAHCLG